MAGMLIFLFLASIALSNVMVTYLDPVTVWPGVYAPAGVYLVAITLVLRDLVQRFHGLLGLGISLLGGIGLSYWFAASQIVSASLVAFLCSFLVDWAVFSLVWYKMRGKDSTVMVTAVLVSGMVSIVVDSFLFLWLADLLVFLPGQIIGKAWGTILGALMVWAVAKAFPREEVNR